MKDPANSRIEKLWVWYGEDATSEEKKEWSSIKKMITLGAGTQAIRDVFTRSELNQLRIQLTKEGWLEHSENTRLTMWTK